MPLLYTRTEDQEKIVIAYKYKALVYIFFVIPFALSFTEINTGWLFLSMSIFLAGLIFGFAKPNREIKVAMAKQQVLVSGKNFSLSNPLTFTIKK